MRLLGVALGMAVAAAVGVGVATTAIPDSDGVVHACRKVDGGRLRAVARETACRDNERPLHWNVRGPQGEPGPAGPAGPQGEPGAGIASFDDLAGLACTRAGETGTIELGYAADGVAQLRCVVASEPPPPDVVLRVNEFSTGVEGALADEFVEIVNAGATSADLSGYKVVYRSAAGTSDVSLATVPEGTTLAPGAFLLFGGAGYAGAHPADLAFSAGLASSGGGVALRDAAGALVDSVGWGTATNAFVEGSAAVPPVVAPAPGKSDARHPDGHDTNVNSADFTEGDPTPGAAN